MITGLLCFRINDNFIFNCKKCAFTSFRKKTTIKAQLPLTSAAMISCVFNSAVTQSVLRATHAVSFILTFLPADLMAESARVRREAQEAKTQAGEDKQEAEQDSTKMAAEGPEGDDPQDKEPREEPGSQGSS